MPRPLAWAFAFCLTANPAAAGQGTDRPRVSQDVLRRQAAETARLGQVVQEVLGPLPAFATTPFFGLAALTGAALVSDMTFVRESNHAYARRFREHALIREARGYASPLLFLLLVLLTLVSYLANSGKIRGIAGKLIRLAEDSSVSVCYFLLALAAAMEASSGPASRAASLAGPLPLAAASPGVFGGAAGFLVAVAVGIGLALMMVVRFAFDVLIWLSPFPVVDLAFETAKKVFSAGFLLLCLTFPLVATALSILILALSLLLLGWALRLLSFALHVLLNPILGRLFPPLRPRLLDPMLAAGGRVTLAAPAHVLGARGLRKRQAGILLAEDGQIFFRFRKRPFGAPEKRPLVLPGERPLLGRALGWIELRVVDATGAVTDRLALSRLLLPEYDDLRRILRAEDAATFGAGRLSAPASSAPVTSGPEPSS